MSQEKSESTKKNTKKSKVEDYLQSTIDYANKIGGANCIIDAEGNMYAMDKDNEYYQNKNRRMPVI